MVKNINDMTVEELVMEIKWELTRTRSENQRLRNEIDALKVENKRLLSRLQHSEQERFKQFFN